jgi:MFS family permease
MIWPFLLVYVGKRVDAPLTAIASLLTLNSVMGLIASFMGGPLIDRIGRKWIMTASLAINGLAYLFMGNAATLPQFAILMSITGSVNPLYRVGADAMMADLVPADKRIDAYALFRLSNNLGIAIGPAIGGFIAATSYSLAFYFAAGGMIAYSLLLTFFAKETLPSKTGLADSSRASVLIPREKFGGYIPILKDLPFIGFILSFMLVSMCATLVWVLLPVYATENFSLPMQLYGLIPTTNAVMVVTLQLFVTRMTKRFPTLPVVAAGALFYALAVGAIALMSGFWGFLLCMIVMTVGELIIVPTSSTYVANRAPVDKRGRYMSLYALTWGMAVGISPVFGGLLNDRFGPSAIWIGGAVVGSISVIAFLLLERHARNVRTRELASIPLTN